MTMEMRENMRVIAGKTNEHETNKKIDKKTRETAICFCKEIMSE